jgi:peroxiredoxin
MKNARQFADANTRVLLVYPGAGENLKDRAGEFLGGTTLPENFVFLTDPDYSFVNLYHLRWDAENETAYPSTFVVDRQNVIRYAKISQTHGDRAPVDDVLRAARDAK